MSASYRWPVTLGIAGLLFFLAGTWTFVQGFGGWNAGFQGPGTIHIEIPAGGDYRLWHESETVIDGHTHRVDDEMPSGAGIEFFDAQGNTISMEPQRGSMSQEIGSTRRVALGRINFPDAGIYTASITGFETVRRFRLTEIRFLEHFLRSLMFLVPGVLLFMTGLIWGIVIAARDRKRSD